GDGRPSPRPGQRSRHLVGTATLDASWPVRIAARFAAATTAEVPLGDARFVVPHQLLQSYSGRPRRARSSEQRGHISVATRRRVHSAGEIVSMKEGPPASFICCMSKYHGPPNMTETLGHGKTSGFPVKMMPASAMP